MMSVHYLVYLGVILCVQFFGSGAVDENIEYVTGNQFYDPRQVKEYNDYGSVSLFPFRLPDRVSDVRWQLMKHRSNSKCPHLTFHVALQNGSFPIVNPLNESFPDHMYRSNPDMVTYEIADDLTLILFIKNPNPGYWFLTAWLPHDEDDRIKQEGLSTECYYFLQAIMTYRQIASVQTLNDIASTPYRLHENETFVIFRYFAELRVKSIQVSITGCVTDNEPGWCPISLSFEANRFPLESEPILKCNTSKDDSCSFTVSDPWQDSWYYLRVNKTKNGPLTVDFNVEISVTACTQFPTKSLAQLTAKDELLWYRRTNMSDEANHAYETVKERWTVVNERITGVYEEATFITPPDDNHLYILSPDELQIPEEMALCPKTISLSSFEGQSSPFKTWIRSDNNTDLYTVPVNGQIIAKFFMDPVLDIGGTMKIKANIDSENTTTHNHNITIAFCLMRGSPPPGSNCSSEFGFTIRSDDPVTWHIPFPAGGWWYMSMQALCVPTLSNNQCPSSVVSRLQLSMIECIDICGPNGGCHVYHQDGFRLYGCVCQNGYGGWACTDDTHAWSRAYFLTQVLLLTLSNIFFILPVILAMYRHFFAEAVVYFCTLIFSTFYHACDSSKFCIMDYNTLQFCDFFASFMAIFVTLIVMAKLPSSLKQTLHMLGTFGLALGTTYNRFSLWAAVVPIGFGVIVVLSSWGYRWNKRRRCYPTKRRWLLYIVPGIVITSAGLLIFAFFETESNYQYVHSVWHACMAFGVLLLLPPRTRKDRNSDDMWSVVQTETYTPMGTGVHDAL
ncbi:post-GPI attachment to proteins factor 6-like isoform X2 [Amphiura filiformis]|uniref:post-GPI attachment to proteins factor 6-like isoform X2 n=1 Tax=Amphiura filiformis TaxID=82378 RepID=UPI003B21D8C5